MAVITLPIAGMTGASCALHLEHVLARVEGVVGASVNFASERATITYVDERLPLALLTAAVREAGYAVPLESIRLTVNDLVYASSTRTVMRVLGAIAGVIAVDVDLAVGQVRVEAPAGQSDRAALSAALRDIGLHAEEPGGPSNHSAALARIALATIAALALIGSAMAGAWSLAILAALAVVVTGWPFYRRAFAALAQGEYDAPGLCALLTLAMLAGSGVLLLISTLASMSVVWTAASGFALAGMLAVGWPGARAVALVSNRSPAAGFPALAGRRVLWSFLAGMAAALVMLGLYLGILSLANSPAHALDQFVQDQWWVLLVALGFGAQWGMHTYARLIARTAHLAGVTAVAGAGSGTSTLGMIACCAHHVSDAAPLMTLLGASGVSGFAAALNEWKVPVILLGLAMNSVGVYYTWRAIRRLLANQSPADIGHAPAAPATG